MILARHAEALFWAGRQIERAEHTARALDLVGRNAMHVPTHRVRSEWQILLESLGVDRDFADSGGVPDSEPVARFLFDDHDNGGSIVSSVRLLRENIRIVRDRVPVELWEEVNRLHLELEARTGPGAALREPFETYSSVRRGCQTITGVVAEAMPRDEGYAFLVLGRMIERAITTCRLIRSTTTTSSTLFDVAAVARLASSLQAFRRAEGYSDDRVALAGFLLCSDDVPRSVLSCLRRAEERLEPLLGFAPGLAPARQMCGRMRSMLEFGDLDRELQADVGRVVVRLERDLVTMADLVSTHAFRPAQSPELHAQFVRPGAGGAPVSAGSGSRAGSVSTASTPSPRSSQSGTR